MTLFLRKLGLSDYYIIKIYALVGEAAIALTEDNPYWLLEEFPGMRFAKVDEVASLLGMEKDSYFRLEAAIKHGIAAYISNGHTFVPAREFCAQMSEHLAISSESIEDVMEDMALSGDLQLTVIDGKEVLYFYSYYKTESQVVSKLVELAETRPKQIASDLDAVISKAEIGNEIKLSEKQRQAVKNSLEHSVSIITGGPGTGKTTIINTLIKIFENAGRMYYGTDGSDRPDEGVDLYYANMNGTDHEGEKYSNIGNVEAGEWINYTVNVEKPGYYKIRGIISSEYKAANKNGEISIISEHRNLLRSTSALK